MEEYYKIGIIYQIYNINDPKIHYIGSSFNDISIRWQDHVSDYNKYLKDDRKPASTIYPYFKEFDIKNFEIRELSEYKVTCNAHLKMYEQLYINKYKPVNRINPFNILANVDRKNYQKQHYINHKEEKSEYGKQRYINNKEYFDNYVENNRERIKEYKAQHYQKNKEKIAEQQKTYRENNKEKVKERKKEHYNNNKEQILKQKSEYYNKNKKELNEKRKEKITCNICKSQVARSNYNEHIKTNKHINNLKYKDDIVLE